MQRRATDHGAIRRVASLLGDAPCDANSAEIQCSFEETTPTCPRPLQLSVGRYRHVVDQRNLELLEVPDGTESTHLLGVLSGRQVGSLGRVVATGRSFSILVHVTLAPGGREVHVAGDLISSLTSQGQRLTAERPVLLDFVSPRASERPDLLECEPEATHWARAWGLSPRLASLAVALMGGMTPAEIAAQFGISEKSVRTYTERLFERAGIHSRGQLRNAALLAE